MKTAAAAGFYGDGTNVGTAFYWLTLWVYVLVSAAAAEQLSCVTSGTFPVLVNNRSRLVLHMRDEWLGTLFSQLCSCVLYVYDI